MKKKNNSAATSTLNNDEVPKVGNEPNINYTKKAFYSTSTVLIFSVFAAVFAYLFRLLLAKKLTIEEYGLFFSLVAFIGVFNIIRDLGLGQASFFFVPRFVAKNKKKELKGLIRTIFNIQVISSASILILLVIFSDFLAKNYFNYGTFLTVILFAVSNFFFSYELTIQTLFNAFQNQFLFSLQNLLRSVLILVFTFVAFMFFNGVNVPIVMQLVAYVILLAVFSNVFFKNTFPEFFSLKMKKMKLKTLFLFGLANTFFYFGFFLITSTDTIMLTYLRNLTEVGLYNAAVPIVSLMLQFPFAISAVIIPLSSELWARKRIDVVRSTITQSTKYAFIILLPVAGILIIYPEFILSILFGSAFVPAATALRILAIGSVFYGVGFLNTNFIVGMEGPAMNAKIFITAAVLNIILNLMLIPGLGINGAAIATSISYLAIFVLSSAALYKKSKAKFCLKDTVIIFASAVMFMVVMDYLTGTLFMNEILESIVAAGISGIVYLVMIFLFRIITIQELMELKKQILKK